MLCAHVNKINTRHIVLGSSSPRRKNALTDLGIKFEVIPSKFEENLEKKQYKYAVDYNMATTRHKAQEIYERVFKGKVHNETADLIICADTIVVLNNQIIEKPESESHAFQILSSLSGKQHTVYTSMCFVFPKIQDPETKSEPWVHSFHESSEVLFSHLSDDMIKGYIATGSPMDKAGGYGIQDCGGSFIEKIHGDYFNVTGFPMNRFCRELLQIIESNKWNLD
mmetsp:Transcript_9589/g.13201  ORF Transcript_9589/g.13201 Transcript_9589/m.13201 type:complete len:224 (+) Transcript_9589:52-723(+)